MDPLAMRIVKIEILKGSKNLLRIGSRELIRGNHPDSRCKSPSLSSSESGILGGGLQVGEGASPKHKV